MDRLKSAERQLRESRRAYEAAEAEYQSAWRILEGFRPGRLGAAPMAAPVAASAVAPAGANGAGRRKRRGKRPPMSDARKEALQAAVLKAMKPGQKFTGSELMELAGYSGPEHTFVRSIRSPLFESRKLKKTVIVPGSRAPRHVRWVRG